MISDPQKSAICLLCEPRLDRYWGLIKMKKHIWWSFSVADASFLCLSSGVSSRLVPPTWEDHHPQKIGGVH